MQAFPHVSLQQSFLEVKIRAYLALLPRRSACGVFRMSQRRAAIAETCGKLYNLYRYPLRSYNVANHMDRGGK